MNNLKKILCVLSLAFLVMAVTGCVQAEDAAVYESENGDIVVGLNEGQSVLCSHKESTMLLVNQAVELMNEKR